MPKQSTTTDPHRRRCYRCDAAVGMDGDTDTIFTGDKWIIGVKPRCGACVREDDVAWGGAGPLFDQRLKCSACKAVKLVEEFWRSSTSVTGRRAYCKPCARARARVSSARRYVKAKADLAEIKSKPCMDCGGSFPPYVMHLDHREWTTKVERVSAMCAGGISTRVLAEIAKCDLVCANCHAIRTHQRSQIRGASRPAGRPISG